MLITLHLTEEESDCLELVQSEGYNVAALMHRIVTRLPQTLRKLSSEERLKLQQDLESAPAPPADEQGDDFTITLTR